MKKYRKPYRIKRRKSIWKNRFFWISIFSLIISGGIFYFFIFSEFFQVEKTLVTGEKKALTDGVKLIVEEGLVKKISFFETKSIFLVNFNKINEILLKKFPQIGKIDFKREFPDGLIIEVEERKPIAIFSQDENYFFIDKEGVIFEKLSEEEPQKLKIKNLTLEYKLELGEKAIKKELLTQILEIESKLKETLKISIAEFSIISQEQINAKTSEGWEIYFNPEEDLNWQITKLKAVLEEKIPPERRTDLEYIELRFGNFAPYKYKD